jgi:hypothetical protein
VSGPQQAPAEHGPPVTMPRRRSGGAACLAATPAAGVSSHPTGLCLLARAHEKTSSMEREGPGESDRA